MISSVTISPLPGIPMIQKGDNLVAIILEAVQRADQTLRDGDTLVITSKIVSKAEGRQIDLHTVTPSEEATQLAKETGKDPRIVQVILQESNRISRKKMGVLVTEHRLGFVSANAGIDQSNVTGDDEHILILPANPDATAEAIRTRIIEETGAKTGIIISDTHGRPFRMGNVGVAIGVAGMPALLDLRGQEDLFGRVLKVSTQGYADLVASAAHLVCGEGNEGLPVVLVRGLQFDIANGKASDLNRPPELDLYR